jgi:diketogulonate reductase-like aldo/keto reductase
LQAVWFKGETAMAEALPLFLYGTAWKEDATEQLTLLAIEQGFRGIDTANQRKHYHEAGVGQAVKVAICRGLVQRDELFLQTKFTFRAGQDERLPYDPNAAIEEQVAQSFDKSLEHLQTDRIDSYVLHGPSRRMGLGAVDWAAWRAMEAIHDSGRVRYLGVSNVFLDQLELLVKQARVKPRFVQNRCYASRGWDRDVREFCAANDIVYQGFSLLTANRDVLANSAVALLARKYHCSAAQIVFRFALDVGMLPLTGTTAAAHMQADLAVAGFQLTAAEIEQLDSIDQ